MNRILWTAVAAVTGVMTSGLAQATPVVLTGNYLEVGISDGGTFGSDGNTSPGILHDPTGTGNFGINDYLTPGTPHDGFTLASDQFYSNNDNVSGGGGFGSTSPTLLTGAAAKGYANAATWSGTNGFVNLTNNYFFNDGDQRIVVQTIITALSALTNVAFNRSVDPDPDVNTYGSYSTDNQRGNSLYSADDFVSGSGPLTGLTLGLVNLNGNTLAHTTQVNTSCCTTISPYDVLAHTGGDAGVTSTGDYGLNLAYNIGALKAGDSLMLTYAYAVGDNVETTGGDTTSAVPEPAVWLMMILGFGMVGTSLRRSSTGNRSVKPRLLLA